MVGALASAAEKNGAARRVGALGRELSDTG